MRGEGRCGTPREMPDRRRGSACGSASCEMKARRGECRVVAVGARWKKRAAERELAPGAPAAQQPGGRPGIGGRQAPPLLQMTFATKSPDSGAKSNIKRAITVPATPPAHCTMSRKQVAPRCRAERGENKFHGGLKCAPNGLIRLSSRHAPRWAKLGQTLLVNQGKLGEQVIGKTSPRGYKAAAPAREQAVNLPAPARCEPDCQVGPRCARGRGSLDQAVMARRLMPE